MLIFENCFRRLFTVFISFTCIVVSMELHSRQSNVHNYRLWVEPIGSEPNIFIRKSTYDKFSIIFSIFLFILIKNLWFYYRKIVKHKKSLRDYNKERSLQLTYKSRVRVEGEGESPGLGRTDFYIRVRKIMDPMGSIYECLYRRLSINYRPED